jgi:trehalose-6-phosphate synthase
VRILVTDLDGTLLAGTDDERAQLRDALAGNRIVVVFATGRGRATTADVLADPLVPRPDWVIADVGSTVCDGALGGEHPVQRGLRRAWPGSERVLAAVREFGVTPQDVPQEGRCAFYAETVPEGLPDVVAALGCELLHSGGRYLDVLPRGVDKGAALTALAAHEGWDVEHILVAGDSLNDQSLFTLGAHGVVMADAEPALLGPRSRLTGAAAIHDALVGLGWATRRHDLVIGYHRAPILPTAQGWLPPSSPNGILPTVSGMFAGGLPGVWATTAPGSRQDHHGSGLPLEFLHLSGAEWTAFVGTACKEALWPLLMSQPQRVRFAPAAWRVYQDVNKRFADHIAGLARPGATVWLHDYNLWLVPAALREARPDLTIGLFHHTPFPSPEDFAVFPAAEEIRASLSHLDWAGFHVDRFARHFRAVVGSGPATGVHPLGIDRRLVEDLAVRPARGPRPLVLSVERLDYVKAPVHKVDTIATLLPTRPDLHGRLVFRLVCPPPEPGITAYDDTRRQLERRVREVNAAWETPDWRPIEYIPTALSFPEVVRHYAAADVFWVTSLQDGMNLTALEFVAAQAATDGDGVLVLSRHAGAAELLHAGALLTDPDHPVDLVSTLEQALDMAGPLRKARIKLLADAIGHTTLSAWGNAVLADIRDARNSSGHNGSVRAVADLAQLDPAARS